MLRIKYERKCKLKQQDMKYKSCIFFRLSTPNHRRTKKHTKVTTVDFYQVHEKTLLILFN